MASAVPQIRQNRARIRRVRSSPRTAFNSFAITPFLWFDANADEAVNFYLTVFKNSRRTEEVRTPGGKILTILFELNGQRFIALNGGPLFKFTEAISFVVRCDSQKDVDEYWSKFTADGAEGQCGWLKVKFGLSWQIVPAQLPKKLNIAELERASQLL